MTEIINLAFQIMAVSIFIGPGIYFFFRWNNEDKNTPDHKRIEVGSVMLALCWTTGWLAYSMYERREDWKQTQIVCKAFEDEFRKKQPTDDDWNELYEEDWWQICNPEYAPEPPDDY